LVRNPHKTYCSGSCYYTGRVYARGPDHPLWKGGTYVSSGYLYEIDRAQPTKIDGGYRYKAQHIRIAEEHLGRKLQKGEHVHHLNGDKMDNRWDNFVLLSNSDHRALHSFYSQRFQEEHAASGNLAAITQAWLAEHP
jgi:hypothetical protein